MVELNVRSTEWYRRFFASGKWPLYANFYMWKKRRLARASKVGIAQNMDWLKRENYPIYRVEIDLVNRCNMDCSFCAQSRTEYKLPMIRMPDFLFEKIMRELGEMNYSHSLYLSCNFEPLLDKDIVKRAELARKLVPNCYLLFFTNGLGLNPEKYHALMKSLSMMFIDNYTDNAKKLIPSLQRVIPEMTDDEAARTVIYMRLQNEVLDSISGEAPSRKNSMHKFGAPLNVGCTYPLSELQIGSDGNVHLCSKDVKWKYVLGNLNFQTIRDVWYGEKFAEARKTLESKWRDGLEICKTCDFIRRTPDETMELNSIYTQKKTVSEVLLINAMNRLQ